MKQALTLIKQHRLFSTIYIVGTAITIVMTMTMFIIFYVKFGPVYPEQHRDRTLVVKATKRFQKGKPENWNINGGHCYSFGKEYLAKAKHVEAIASRLPPWTEYNISASKGRSLKTGVSYTNGDFWKVFDFDFIAGHPYTEKDVEANANVAVISASLAKQLFDKTDVVGNDIIISDTIKTRVIGVVKDCSSVSIACYSLIWMPVNNSLKIERDNDPLLGNFHSYLLCDSKKNMPLVQKEVERMVEQMTKESEVYEYSIMGQPDTYIKSTFRTDVTKEPDSTGILRGFLYLFLAILIIPSLNLSGMISSRMNGRLSELGIRKAYGASNSQLLFKVFNENLLLTAIGSVVGLIVTFIIIYAASDWVLVLFNEELEVWTSKEINLTSDMLFNPWVFLATFAICLVLNTMSALIPASAALRKSIIESLSSKK